MVQQCRPGNAALLRHSSSNAGPGRAHGEPLKHGLGASSPRLRDGSGYRAALQRGSGDAFLPRFPSGSSLASLPAEMEQPESGLAGRHPGIWATPRTPVRPERVNGGHSQFCYQRTRASFLGTQSRGSMEPQAGPAAVCRVSAPSSSPPRNKASLPGRDDTAAGMRARRARD